MIVKRQCPLVKVKGKVRKPYICSHNFSRFMFHFWAPNVLHLSLTYNKCDVSRNALHSLVFLNRAYVLSCQRTHTYNGFSSLFSYKTWHSTRHISAYEIYYIKVREYIIWNCNMARDCFGDTPEGIVTFAWNSYSELILRKKWKTLQSKILLVWQQLRSYPFIAWLRIVCGITEFVYESYDR